MQTIGLSGSSPLTRGKLGLDRGLRNQRGLIPAHAGKTGPTNPCPPTPRAHPRSRGENVRRCRRGRGRGGSSPLTRGKPSRAHYARDAQGLIPAHAGKTPKRRREPRSLEAHPRSRGENDTAALLAGAGAGSSPLTRGKLLRALLGIVETGLIPAHAGKTRATSRDSLTLGAHPRSRGENFTNTPATRNPGGSSPLTRGKRPPGRPHLPKQRLIPAHAGKTYEGDHAGGLREAHPRSRGENPRTRSRTARCGGSSPLTRGKQLR